MKDSPELIEQYEAHHKKVWPEIITSIRSSGIEEMEIFRLGTRLFMIMETNENFSFERKAQMDKANLRVQEWEALMWKYQEALEGTAPGEKWIILNKIFDLNEQ